MQKQHLIVDEEPVTTAGNKRRRGGQGFASLPPERRSELARQGARRAHELGVAHRWTSEEAQAAGRKGGRRSGESRRFRTLRGGNEE